MFKYIVSGVFLREWESRSPSAHPEQALHYAAEAAASVRLTSEYLILSRLAAKEGADPRPSDRRASATMGVVLASRLR